MLNIYDQSIWLVVSTVVIETENDYSVPTIEDVED